MTVEEFYNYCIERGLEKHEIHICKPDSSAWHTETLTEVHITTSDNKKYGYKDTILLF